MRNQITLTDIGQEFATNEQVIRLFDGIDLNIEAGQSHAIVGPSGSGKSSLLMILAGLDAPASGSVDFRLDGKAVDATTARANSGFVFQQFHLLPELGALANLALPLRLKGDADANDKAAMWLDRVGLHDRKGHLPSRLSGGEQQRVAIARAFITEPAFLFADEPTGNLDNRTSAAIADLMFECALSAQTAMTIVTHSDPLARRADHSWSLRDGRLEKRA